MAKRQRKVFPTSKIAGLFATQSVPEARNPQGNFYFRGTQCFSYRNSFLIAQLVKRGEETVAVFTTATHSKTTAGHVSDVRWALQRHGIPIIPMNLPADPVNVQNRHWAQRQVTNLIGQTIRSIKYADSHVRTIKALMDAEWDRIRLPECLALGLTTFRLTCCMTSLEGKQREKFVTRLRETLGDTEAYLLLI